jgi:hypothetical protein
MRPTTPPLPPPLIWQNHLTEPPNPLKGRIRWLGTRLQQHPSRLHVNIESADRTTRGLLYLVSQSDVCPFYYASAEDCLGP